MFRPSCGSTDQTADYCRRRGQSLIEVESAQKKALKKREGRMRSMVVFNALSAVFALTSAIILYSTYLNTPEAKWSVYVAGALCSVIAVHQTISFFFALDVTRRLSEYLRRSGRLSKSDFERGSLLNSPATAEILQSNERKYEKTNSSPE